MKNLLIFSFLIISFNVFGQKVEIREGSSIHGKIVCTYDVQTGFVREGNSPYGVICFYIDKNKVRINYSKYGPIVYTIDKNHIRVGDNIYGEIKYTIDGSYIRQGHNKMGKILYNIRKY